MEEHYLWNSVKKKWGKWFTLVELLVIVSIVAILGTIGFLSYTWYTIQTRNVKRSSDLHSIINNIEISFIDSVSLFSMLDNTWSTLTSTASWDNIQISWRRYPDLNGYYEAWDINYRILWLEKDKFLDPSTNKSYKLWVTSLWYRYEIGATLEKSDWWDSLIMWNRKPRTSLWARWEWTGILWNRYYLVSWNSAESTWLKQRDIVNIGTWATSLDYVIIGLKWNKVYLDQEINQWGDNIYLQYDETRHLIKRWDSNWAIDIWKGNIYTPYEIN